MTVRPPLILASGSTARKAMLGDVGLPFIAMAADIDERALTATLGTQSVDEIALTLAQAKAKHVSTLNKSALVIGSDQMLGFEGGTLSKAANREEARTKLRALRGKTHSLHSAVCVVLDGDCLFECVDTAYLSMRDFDDDFLNDYLIAEADTITSCVGAYKIEGAGQTLFSDIDGDMFTIMGMPLSPLLDFLRTEYGYTS